MSGLNLRRRPRVSYCEIEEPNLDEYIFCEECADFVYEYCSIHGPLLVIPDDKVPPGSNVPACVPRAALTVPRVFLHLAPSTIPGAGVGVFSTLTLPRGVRFGPYRGTRSNDKESKYGWQLHNGNNKWSHLIDASDANASNWMRYVNCARHWCEQNLLAYQYQGHIYYRTIKIIPRFTELMVFYGSEFACLLGIDLKHYNSPPRILKEIYEPQQSLNPKVDTNTKIQKTEESIDKTIKDRKNTKNRSSRSKNPREITKKKDKINTTRKVKKRITRTVNDIRDTEKPLIQKSGKDNDGLNVSNKKNEKNISINVNNQNISINVHKHSNGNNINEQKTRNENFICNDCGRNFVCKDGLTAHVKEHISKSGIVNLENTNKPLRRDISQQTNTKNNNQINNKSKPFQCTTCDFKSVHKRSLVFHTRTHTGEKPYKCLQCNKCFAHISSLTTHIRTHTGEKPYKCTQCNRCFTAKSNLTYHLRTHTGEKPYKCLQCNKCFSQICDLNTHIRTHTGEKPYKCLQCNKCFSRISNLNTHIRTHTGEKPYKCLQCNKCFAHISSLTTHIRTHTGEKPYKCTQCNRCFTAKSNLTYHLRTHTGEKPYKCLQCNKCFSQICDLNTHIRTHTGEKPYKCLQCNKCFSRISNLNTHIRTHTGEKPYK